MRPSKLLPLCTLLAVWGLSPLPVRAQAGATAPGRIEQDIRTPPEPVARPPIVIERPLFPAEVPAGAGQVRFDLGAV